MKKTTLILLVLFGIFFLRGLYLNSHYSLTSDEPGSYAIGYSAWKTGDFGLEPTHPPFKGILTQIFTAHLNPQVPIPPGFPNFDVFLYGKLLVFQFNQGIFQQLIFWGRLPYLLIGLLGAWYVYLWASKITGKSGALFATALYLSLPLIVSMSAINDNDILISTFSLITLYYFSEYLKSGKTKDAALTGLNLGLALYSKHTGIMLIPLMAVAALLLMAWAKKTFPMLPFISTPTLTNIKSHWKKNAVSFLAFFALLGIASCLVLNVGYGFQGSFTPLGKYEFKQNFFTAFNSPAFNWIPAPLPHWYLKGLETNQIFSKDPHYFHGEWVVDEDWYFFILSFILKTPLSLLIMIAMATFMYSKLSKGREIDFTIMLVFVVGLTFFFTINEYKLGIRHLLPIYPLIFVLLASLWHYAMKESKSDYLKWGMLLLLAWYVASSALVHPHYLSYYNELIGGSKNGYKWFIDSNTDWGQDLNEVKRWMDRNGVQEIGLSYFGSDVPELRGIRWHVIPCEPTPGLHVLSVNNLFGHIFTGQPKHCYAWLREVQPVDRIGYSMLVFSVSSELAQSLAVQGSQEEAPPQVRDLVQGQAQGNNSDSGDSNSSGYSQGIQ